METKKKTNFPLSLCVGCLAVVAIATIIWGVEKCIGVTLLATEEERIANYLSLMGLSFSVTFITTSLFGGLSDKSEKIYWLSYPESYLINSTLNFMILSVLSFICLGIQAAVTVMLFLPEEVRESVFFSSFLVGIITIVILSYRFTAVFFRRKKLLKKTEQLFDQMIEDKERTAELKRAVVGLFNNTLEAVLTDSCNFERVSENVNLLLKYSDNDTCVFWLRKLIVEIGRNNTSMLLQLVLEMEGSSYYEKFTYMLEIAALSKDAPFDGGELLNTIYGVRLKEFKKKLGSEKLFVDGSADGENYERWSNVARELNVLLTKIDTSRVDNCMFVLENLKELPFELLQNNNCIKKINDVWENILQVVTECVDESDTVSYQKLEKMIFDFLYEHPATYFDDGEMCFGCKMKDQLSSDLHEQTATVVGRMNYDQLSYMIDVIEEETDRNKFILWFANQMAKGTVSEELWALEKKADYNSNGVYHYYEDFAKCICAELEVRREAVKASYAKRDATSNDRYYENLSILECADFADEFIRLLHRVKKYEKTYGDNSVVRFIKLMINDACVGEVNSFTHDPYDMDWESCVEEETVLNRYAEAFDVLLTEQDGLLDLQKAIELTDGNGEPVNNYFKPSSDEEKQKRGELLFFLEHVCEACNDDKISQENKKLCAEIIARILTNPCIGPVSKNPSENPEGVNKCLEFVREQSFSQTIRDFVSEMNTDYSVLAYLYMGASCREDAGEQAYAAHLQNVADAFKACIDALGEVL